MRISIFIHFIKHFFFHLHNIFRAANVARSSTRLVFSHINYPLILRLADSRSCPYMRLIDDLCCIYYKTSKWISFDHFYLQHTMFYDNTINRMCWGAEIFWGDEDKVTRMTRMIRPMVMSFARISSVGKFVSCYDFASLLFNILTSSLHHVMIS